jgi:hypothetical protein
LLLANRPEISGKKRVYSLCLDPVDYQIPIDRQYKERHCLALGTGRQLSTAEK